MRVIIALTTVALLTGCVKPEQEFWGRVSGLCENAYAGEMLTDDPRDASFKSAQLAVSFDECSRNRIDMFLVKDGEPYAKWVLTRSGQQLELRHIHKEGLTGYGGYSADKSSGSRASFPADIATQNIFDQAGLDDAKKNVWAMSVRSGSVFTYELERPGREVVFAFNITNPVEFVLTPEQKSGYEDQE